MIDKDKIWDLDSGEIDSQGLNKILDEYEREIVSLSEDLVSISDQANRISVVIDVLLSMLKNNVSDAQWENISNSINASVEKFEEKIEEERKRAQENIKRRQENNLFDLFNTTPGKA